MTLNKSFAVGLNFSLGVGLSFCVLASHAEVTLDSQQAVQFAVENSPEFNSIKQRLAIADLEESSAFYRFFPSLDLNAVHGIEDSDPRLATLGTGAPWASRTTLSLTQSLYDNGETNSKYKIAKLNKEQALLNFNEQKNKLALDIMVQFLNYSLNVKLVDIQEKQFSMMTRQYQSVSKDFYQGVKTKKDFLRFKTQVNRIEIDLATAKTGLEKSRLALLKLLGAASDSNESYTFVPIDLEKINDPISNKALTTKNHYMYRYADLQRSINDLNYNLIGRKNWPELLFTAGASYGSSQYVNSNQSFSDNDVVSWNALITLKYNFFDWGVRSRDADVAFLKSKIQNNDLQVSLLGIDSIVKELKLNTRQAQRNFGLAKDLLKLEKDNLGFLQTEYRNGKVQYLDLVTGYDNLADAEFKFYSAASEFENIRYLTLYHQGLLYEEILK